MSSSYAARLKNFVAENAVWLGYLLAAVTYIVWEPVFFTIDGPAHAYTQKISLDLLQGGSSKQLFGINEFPVPYWGVYFLLSIYDVVASTALAEKLTFITIIALYCIGVRYFLKKSNAGYWKQLLFLPLFITTMLLQGFLNYLLAGAIGLLTVAYWDSRKATFHTLRSVIVLSALLIATFFTHPVGFAVTGVVLFMHVVVYHLSTWRRNSNWIFHLTRGMWPIALASLPALAMVFLYASRVSGGFAAVSRLDLRALGDMVIFVRPLVHYTHLEGNYTLWYGLCIWMLFGAALHTRLRTEEFRLHPGDTWLAIAGVFALLVILVPDFLAEGGGLTYRLYWWFLLFTLLFVASATVAKWLQVVGAVCAVVLVVHHLTYYAKVNHDLNGLVVEYQTAAPFIPENATVLPLSHGVTWLDYHIHDYLVYDKLRLVFDNTVAWLDRSAPVQWNPESHPAKLAFATGGGNYLRNACADLEQYHQQANLPIDYVVLWGPTAGVDTTDCFRETYRQLQAGYSRIHVSPKGFLQLYQRNE